MRGIGLGAVVLAASVGLALGATSPSVTISARPLVVRADRQVSLSGQIAATSANEYVAIQGKECGVPGAFFRLIGGTVTTEGGGWTTQQMLRTTTDLRAVWKGKTSAVVTVRRRLGVNLVQKSRSRFQVSLYGIAKLDGMRMLIERFDRPTRTWQTVRSIVMEARWYAEFALKDDIRISVPKGTTLRAHLPLSEAGPCYLAGYSKLVRT